MRFEELYSDVLREYKIHQRVSLQRPEHIERAYASEEGYQRCVHNELLEALAHNLQEDIPKKSYPILGQFPGDREDTIYYIDPIVLSTDKFREILMLAYHRGAYESTNI